MTKTYTGCVSGTFTPSTTLLFSRGGASSTYAPCITNFRKEIKVNLTLTVLFVTVLFGPTVLYIDNRALCISEHFNCQKIEIKREIHG